MKMGTRIQELLEERNLTQREMGEILHLEPNTINGYVNNRRFPDFETASHIAMYFNTSLDYLVGISNIRHNSEAVLTLEEAALLDSFRMLDKNHQCFLTDFSLQLYQLQKTQAASLNSEKKDSI